MVRWFASIWSWLVEGLRSAPRAYLHHVHQPGVARGDPSTVDSAATKSTRAEKRRLGLRSASVGNRSSLLALGFSAIITAGNVALPTRDYA